MHPFQSLIVGIHLKYMMEDPEPMLITKVGTGSDIFSSPIVYHVFDLHHFIILMMAPHWAFSSLTSS